MGFQMPEMNGLGAMIAIRKELRRENRHPDDLRQRCIRGNGPWGGAYLLKTTLDKELLPTICAVYSGN